MGEREGGREKDYYVPNLRGMKRKILGLNIPLKGIGVKSTITITTATS